MIVLLIIVIIGLLVHQIGKICALSAPLVVLISEKVEPMSASAHEGKGELIDDIIEIIKPYTKEVGDKHLIAHLAKHYDISAHGKLHNILEKITDTHSFNDALDFIEQSHITYAAFLPEAKVAFVCNPDAEYSLHDVIKVKTEMDKLLRTHGIRLSESKLTEHAKDFLKYNRMFKLKNSIAEKPVSAIKKLNTKKVYEVDIVGLMPKMEYHASMLCEKHDERTLEKIKEYLRGIGIASSGIYSLEDLADVLRRVKNTKNTYLAELEEELSRRHRHEREKEYERAEKRRREQHEALEERRRREQEAHAARMRELRAEFDRRVQADPELVNVATAMGMTLDQLFQQFLQEKSIHGGYDLDDEYAETTFDEEVYEKFRNKILEENFN